MKISKKEQKILQMTKSFFAIAGDKIISCDVLKGLVIYSYANQDGLGFIVINSDLKIFEVELAFESHKFLSSVECGRYQDYLKSDFGKSLKDTIFAAINIFRKGIMD